VLWRPPSVSKSFPDSPTSFHSFNGPQLSMTSITIPPEREYRYLLAMRECDFDLLESPSSLFDQYFPQSSVSRGCSTMGSVLADVQSPLQILNVLLICGSEDVNGTTDVAGMTPYSVLW
jgi:hypothetical protein